MALDLSSTANKLLSKLCNSNDYAIIYETGGVENPDHLVSGRRELKLPSN